MMILYFCERKLDLIGLWFSRTKLFGGMMRRFSYNMNDMFVRVIILPPMVEARV